MAKDKKPLTAAEIAELRKDPLINALFVQRENKIQEMIHNFHRLCAGAGLNPLGFTIKVKSNVAEPWPVTKK